MTSWATTYTPARQPAGPSELWKYLDLSTYDGSVWRDIIEDVNGETWHRVRRYIEADPPWHPISLPGRKGTEAFGLASLKESVRRHRLGDIHGMVLHIDTVAAMITEIERLRALAEEMRTCFSEILDDVEEACDV
jgi:hypothetical protein